MAAIAAAAPRSRPLGLSTRAWIVNGVLLVVLLGSACTPLRHSAPRVARASTIFVTTHDGNTVKVTVSQRRRTARPLTA